MQKVLYIKNGRFRLSEFVLNRLYFVTLPPNFTPKSNAMVEYFSTDTELVYTSFYSDFGPLDIGLLQTFCLALNNKLALLDSKNKVFVHYTSINPQKRANAACLISSYAVIHLGMSPKKAYNRLMATDGPQFCAFRDASLSLFSLSITIFDCLEAISKAMQVGFIDFNDFDVEEYKHYSDMNNGNISWVIPEKMLAFCTPSSFSGTGYQPPELYVDYFLKNNVTVVIRLNKKAYSSTCFLNAGIQHYDLFFEDGGVPNHIILNQFMDISENALGAVAVHCKAGLGRTGCLIAAYLMKHYHFSANHAIAWLRICRPGCVVGRQQSWLQRMEKLLWQIGDSHRQHQFGTTNIIQHHCNSIYSMKTKSLTWGNAAVIRKQKNTVPKSGDAYYPAVGRLCQQDLFRKPPGITIPAMQIRNHNNTAEFGSGLQPDTFHKP